MRDRPRQRWALPGLTLGILLSSAGCASAPTGQAAPRFTPPNYHSARYTSGLSTKIDFAGISLGPRLDQTIVPPVSGAQAFQTCTTGDSLCDPALTPDVYLAEADKPDSNMVNRSVWVIDYQGSTCVPYGHPPALTTASPAQPFRPTPYSCRLLNLIDSSTGKVLWSIRVPE